MAACDRAMALAPDLPEVMVARARLFYSQKKYDESELMARRAIERKRDSDGSWNILGRALLTQSKYEEASKLAEQAIEANGDDYNTYIPYHTSLERLGQKKESENLRRRMIVVCGNNWSWFQKMCGPAFCWRRIWPLLEKQKKPSGIFKLPWRFGPTMATPCTTPRAPSVSCRERRRRSTPSRKPSQPATEISTGPARDTDLDCLHDDPEFQKLVGLDTPAAS